VAVWWPSKPPDPLVPPAPTGLVLPLLAAATSLAILFVGTIRPMNRAALILATVTLLAAGIRFARSAFGLRTLGEERRRQSVTDELTGLANRRFLFDALDELCAQDGDETSERRMAFLFVDLNDFKEINDSFGQRCGDELLRQLGPRFAGSLRGSDLLVRAVTGFVLEEALSQCAAWRTAGRPLAVSVNVSPTNLLEAGFADFIRHLLRRNDLPAELLVIEITETCIFAHLDRSRLVVRDIDLVRATIDLAHAMGLRVVVEGIEDQATLDLVSDFGCEIVQGYYISRPKAADEMFSWLRARDDRAARTRLSLP
jgi:predicted signal transduction protein with EAL and GGDEF domain